MFSNSNMQDELTLVGWGGGGEIVPFYHIPRRIKTGSVACPIWAVLVAHAGVCLYAPNKEAAVIKNIQITNFNIIGQRKATYRLLPVVRIMND